MAGISEKFFGQHFKHWQQRMKIRLTTIGLLSFIESHCLKRNDTDPESAEKIADWTEKDQLCCGCIVLALSNILFDVYSSSSS